ncbi:hypothetical protein [Bacillus thuringiensis]|uniref:hypothetical protein n=1 Tax=Bacillus thuringiensis TaxID=1428 RepID=UPI003DA1C219
MDLHTVINRALNEPEFAQQLKSKAQEAAKKGVHSPEWSEFMSYFSVTPEDLASMGTNSSTMMPMTTMTTTTTTTTTIECTVTTTTTTTTRG